MLTTIAWGLVDTDGTLLKGRGAISSRSAAGAYDLTLSSNLQVDDTEMMITLTPNISGAAIVQAADGGSDTIKPVETFNAAGVATDAKFFFKIEKLNLV